MDEAPPEISAAAPTPESVARLMEIIADHSTDHAVSDMEQTIARLRFDADRANQAQAGLCDTTPGILGAASPLRAAGVERNQ